jgi:ribosomal protein S27AE
MSRNLSQIISDLFARSKGGEDLSSQIKRLGDEMRKVIQSEDAVFGKLRGLLESFREIIPDEQQRYHAALKALSTTAKLSRQEITKAISGQLEELKIVEKGLMPAQSGWRDEMKAMEARAREIKGEIAKLRERAAQLESEEKAILSSMAAREKDLELAEKTIRGLFADIGAEITSINKKVEELPAEGPAAQPVPQQAPMKSDVPGGKKGGGEQKIEIKGAPSPQDTKWQRKCPMCGGQMNLLELENKWQCYACAYEESTTGASQEKSAEKSEPMNAPIPAPGPEPVSPSTSFVEPLASMTNEFEGSTKGTSLPDDQQATKKKKCPVCRKTMYWYPNEKAWRCPSCQYERRI